jgi:hypothetical protein
MTRKLLIDEEAIEEAEAETRYDRERGGEPSRCDSQRRSTRSIAGSRTDDSWGAAPAIRALSPQTVSATVSSPVIHRWNTETPRELRHR